MGRGEWGGGGGGGGGGGVCGLGKWGVVVSEFFDNESIHFFRGGFFYNLTSNPNLTKNLFFFFFFFLGGGGGGGG